jgi:hypothetical protein
MKTISILSPSPLACLAFLLLAACTTPPAGTTPAATAASPAPAASSSSAPAAPADEPPIERPEAAAQCWMKYDRSGASLEAKAKLVDKCITEKMKGQ